MVYVLDKNGKPLMPTNRHGKVRKLLNSKQAIVVKKTPFTIQLLYETTTEIQAISLGVNPGYSHLEMSATTETSVLYETTVKLRTDIPKLLAARYALRHARRSRKTRYRPARYNNRRRAENWLPPSIRQRIDTHKTAIANVYEILPITKLVVEFASYDIQKIKESELLEEDSVQMTQSEFQNLREFILCRDKHTCQCCKGKTKDFRLRVHHIETRQTGGNSPENLVTICETCHTKYHAGLIELPDSIKRGASYKEIEFMNVMRPFLCKELSELYSNFYLTYGYITKQLRENNNLDRSAIIDARCISGNPTAKPTATIYKQQKLRRHNRKIYKDTIYKNGVKRLNRCPNEVFGFRLLDVVSYKHRQYFIVGRRRRGQFTLQDCKTGVRVETSYKNLKLFRRSTNFLITTITT